MGSNFNEKKHEFDVEENNFGFKKENIIESKIINDDKFDIKNENIGLIFTK